MWKILTKDGIYCRYLKWICTSKEKYHESQDEYVGNEKNEIAAASKICLRLLLWM